jgi:hypothetical protein
MPLTLNPVPAGLRGEGMPECRNGTFVQRLHNLRELRLPLMSSHTNVSWPQPAGAAGSRIEARPGQCRVWPVGGYGLLRLNRRSYRSISSAFDRAKGVAQIPSCPGSPDLPRLSPRASSN